MRDNWERLTISVLLGVFGGFGAWLVAIVVSWLNAFVAVWPYAVAAFVISAFVFAVDYVTEKRGEKKP